MEPGQPDPIASTLAAGTTPGRAPFGHGVRVVLDASGGATARSLTASVR